MANRYDQWAPTAPINLPIETYQQAGIYNDQKAQQALASIADTYSAYSNITPFGANAKAHYDRTMDKLRTGVDEITKMDLKTPEAKRRVNQLLGDRSIINPLKNVMRHSMDAATRKKELDEYRKKNPEVNATDYMVAFNQVNLEQGDADAFNPNKFANMNPLGEYYDVNKRMEEGIGKILEDEHSIKQIVGPHYIEEMRSGRGREKIREYVAKSLENDEQVKAQVAQNLKYQYYKSNPSDLYDGRTKYANALRDNFRERAETYQAKLATIKKQIPATKDKATKLALTNEAMMMQKTLDEMATTYSPEIFANDDALGYTAIKDSLIKGFDAFANSKTKFAQTFTPAYLSNLSFSHSLELQRRSQAHAKAMIKKAADDNGGLLPLTRQAPVEQGPLSADGITAYVKNIMPGVTLDKNGAFKQENFTNANFDPKFHINVKDKGQEVVYDKKDIVVPKNEAEAKALERQGYRFSSPNFLQGSPLGSDGNATPWASFNTMAKATVRPLINEFTRSFGLNDAGVYIKPGAKPISASPKQNNDRYEAAKLEIKTKYNSMSATGVLPGNKFETEADYQSAINAIASAHQSFEKTYNQSFTVAGLSNSEDLKNTIATDLPYMDAVDENGKKLDRKEREALAVELMDPKNKSILNFRNYNRTLKLPVYTFTTSKGTFSVPMHTEIGQGFAGSAQAMGMLIENNYNPVAYNGDLFVNAIAHNPDGSIKVNAGVVKGAGTESYQNIAKLHYANNQLAVSRGLGVNPIVADKIMAENYEKIMNEKALRVAQAMQTGNPKLVLAAQQSPFILNYQGKQIQMAAPVINKSGFYYSEAGLPDVNGMRSPYTEIKSFEKNTFDEVQNTLNANNPAIKGYYFKTGLSNKGLRSDLEGVPYTGDGFEGGGGGTINNIPNILD